MMCRVASSAPKRLGLVSFSASHSDSGNARALSRSGPISTLPSWRMDVVLRGLGAIISKLVAEQFYVACIELGYPVDQRCIVIIAVVLAVGAVHLVERGGRNADPLRNPMI